MLEIKDVQSFLDLMKKDTKPIIIDFYADWCGPCKNIAPYFKQLEETHSNIVFVKINVDEADTVAGFLNVSSLPTFMLVKEGRELMRFSGASKNGLDNLVKNCN
jgi:thioredoxin